jgi:hypothetical protein
MSFLIIKGVFNPANGVPDGDSVRFLADDDSLFDQIEGRVEFKSGFSLWGDLDRANQSLSPLQVLYMSLDEKDRQSSSCRVRFERHRSPLP